MVSSVSVRVGENSADDTADGGRTAALRMMAEAGGFERRPCSVHPRGPRAGEMTHLPERLMLLQEQPNCQRLEHEDDNNNKCPGGGVGGGGDPCGMCVLLCVHVGLPRCILSLAFGQLG